MALQPGGVPTTAPAREDPDSRVEWMGIFAQPLEPLQANQLAPYYSFTLPPGTERTISRGAELPPTVQSMWEALFKKHHTNILVDLCLRILAALRYLMETWTEFCAWSRERHEPWAEWSLQIGYEHTSEPSQWRMKKTVQIKNWMRRT
ncbi:Uu.00g084780.m01.CDS01 [Anthostomella pinea]|uniref:Uu.00g084780.m01.CDS01 n=1 Tax=Anthostomella pinea TaxID=933095 RepID=A0AAI8YJS0_9PEZI|nr:Uu.00g084780.m01.CDS01 [Anthostomella pinea]